MDKRLVDLKEEGYLALLEEFEKQQNRQGGINSRPEEEKTINNSLNWMETNQGNNFWSHVNRGNFDRAIDEFPEWKHLFNITEIVNDSEYKIVTNGLFKP
jgi:hypothetical protein